MSGAVVLFWVLAVVKMALSVPVQANAALARDAAGQAFGRSQRKDDWLGCAIMGIAAVCDSPAMSGWLHPEGGATGVDPGGFPLQPLVYLFGTVLLAWLIRRAQERLRLLRQTPKP